MTKPDLSFAFIVFILMFVLMLISSRASYWNGIAEGDRRGAEILEANKYSWFGNSNPHTVYVDGRIFYVVEVRE